MTEPRVGAAEPSLGRQTPAGADRSLRRSSRFLSASVIALSVVIVARLVGGNPGPGDWLIAILVGAAGLAAAYQRATVRALEAGRRIEAESFARVLRGLSRSVSPDAIVDAIVEDLGIGSGADHTIVVRLRPESNVLEATLVSHRPGVPGSTTILPRSDLDDPGEGPIRVTRMPVGMPVGSPVGMPVGSPVEVAVGATVGAHADADRERRVPATLDRRRAPASVGRMGGSLTGGVASTNDRRRTWPVLGAAAAERVDRAGQDLTGGSPDRSDGSPDRSAGSSPDRSAVRIADRIAARVRDVYGLKHTIQVPLVTTSGTVGAIVLSRRSPEPWPASTERLLAGAATEASAALERAYSHRAAETRASTDALTGLPNRRYFDEFCGLLARRRRSDDALGILMIDIDHFKRLNDSHGHAAGDEVLREVAGAIARAVRSDDVPARFGGEEFAVLLRDPGRPVAEAVAERVRASVAALDLSAVGGAKVTVSVGVALSVEPDEPIAATLSAADRALYAAKRRGRNRVEVA